MAERLSEFDIRQEVTRLVQAGYALPRDTTPEGVARIWRDVFRGISRKRFSDAVDAFLRDGGRYFPKPAEIRKLAVEQRGKGSKDLPTDLRSRYLRWELSQEGGCPVCGAAVRMVSGKSRGVPPLVWSEEKGELVRDESVAEDARLFVLHDAERHRQEGVPHVGPPYEGKRREGGGADPNVDPSRGGRVA